MDLEHNGFFSLVVAPGGKQKGVAFDSSDHDEGFLTTETVNGCKNTARRIISQTLGYQKTEDRAA
jgi:hypothetical protein